MDPRHAVLFEPIDIGPKTLPNRFYQVPHASGFGVERPRTHAAFRGIKAEGGWGGVCVDYTSISLECEESPAVSALFWDDADAQGARPLRRGGTRARRPRRDRALPRRRAQRERPVTRHPRRADAAPRALVRGQPGQGDGLPATSPASSGSGSTPPGVPATSGSTSSTSTARTATCCRSSSPRISTSAPTRYGGSLENRGRFWLETLEAVRDAVGAECAIATRIPVNGRDGLPGIETDDMLELIRDGDAAGRPLRRERRRLAGGLRDVALLPRGSRASVDRPRPRGDRQARGRRRPLHVGRPDGRDRPHPRTRHHRRRAPGDRRPVPPDEDPRRAARRGARVHRLERVHRA